MSSTDVGAPGSGALRRFRAGPKARAPEPPAKTWGASASPGASAPPPPPSSSRGAAPWPPPWCGWSFPSALASAPAADGFRATRSGLTHSSMRRLKSA
jgi:hypothetical protein